MALGSLEWQMMLIRKAIKYLKLQLEIPTSYHGDQLLQDTCSTSVSQKTCSLNNIGVLIILLLLPTMTTIQTSHEFYQ